MAQIAQMFTTLGFKVDDAGLKELDTKLSQIRATTAQFATSLGVVADKLGVVKRKVSELNKVLNKDSKSSTSKGATEYYSKLSNYIERVDKAHDSLVVKAPTITSSMNKIRDSVKKASKAWERYGVAIKEAKKHMGGISPKSGVQGAGNVKTTINNITNNYNGSRGAGGSSGSGTPRPNPNQPQGDSGSTIIPLGGVRDFFRSMTPATMMAGGAVSAGYALKEVVNAGREVQKMQTVMLMASDGQKDQLDHNLKFVKDSAMEMGISYTEFGSAYAKMLSATKDSDLSLKSKEDMFTNLSQYMVAIGTTADDQKGVFRALTQMFTKGKVQAEEILQMAERGVPAAMEIKKAALEGLKMTEKEFDLAQKKGLLDPSKLLPLMAKALGDLAVKTGAYAQAVNSSAAAQERLNTKWKFFAHAIMQGGLDKALSKIFDGLGDLIEILTPLVQGIMLAIGGIVDLVKIIGVWYAENPKLGATIVSLTALMVIWTASGATATGTAITMSVALYNLSKYFVLLAKRILPVIILFKAFYDVAQYHKDGEYGWVSVLSAQFELLYARIHLAYNTLRVFWETLKIAPKNALGTLFNTTTDPNATTSEKIVAPTSSTFKYLFMEGVLGIANLLSSSNTSPPSDVVGNNSQNTLAIDIQQNGKTVATENFDLGNSTHRSLILKGV